MAASDSQYENQRFLVLRRFRDLPHALLFRSILESGGIECFLADENTIRMDWFWSNLLGGVKLCVRKADADSAASLLGQGVPEKFDVEGVGEHQQPRCPKCQSLEVSFQGLNKAVDYTRALLGGHLPHSRSLWECDSCAYQWPESSEKPPANFLTTASSILLIFMATGTFLVWLFPLIEALRFAASR
jgi:ribosomal protein L37AE/L43A